MDTANKKWTMEYFLQQRKEVLAMWNTGKDVDLEECVAYQKKLLSSQNAAVKVLEAQKNRQTLLCPSTGTDTIEGHTELLRYMEKEADADLLTTYIDSMTRNCRFEPAKEAVQKSMNSGTAVLNGFPVVVHGIEGNRKVLDSVGLPAILFGPSPDARLTHEIGLGGGHTGYSGGALISFWNYTKNIPVDKIIHNFQYINRLMGYYEENGIPILYCVSGAMPSISPPSLMITPEIIEVLVAAEQGVKHIQLNGWLQGNMAQDTANILTLKKLADKYLARFGYDDVKTTTYSVCPTGRFPTDHSRVYALIAYFALIGGLANVQVLGSRTIDEAHHIPTMEGTAKSFKCAGMINNMLPPQNLDFINSKKIQEECYFIEKEVEAILDKTLEIGDNDIVVGTKRAIEAGILDQPYATTQFVKGKVLGVKDHEGAARFFDKGDLPFDKEILDYHKEKISQREKELDKKVGYETIINDLTAIGNGALLPPQ
jgi:methylaspartate mutase epsilon subunit